MNEGENEKKIIGTRDLLGAMSVGLSGVDNNLRWESPKDMIKLCNSIKC